jgi:hypothetical protein
MLLLARIPTLFRLRSGTYGLTNYRFFDAASLTHSQNFSAAGLSRPFSATMPTEIGFGSGKAANDIKAPDECRLAITGSNGVRMSNSHGVGSQV